jgi:hypothetical protein
MVNVWAVSAASPGSICSNAQVLASPRVLYPAGINPSEKGSGAGQAGWDVGVSFTTFAGLATKLLEIKTAKGSFARLAIDLHGAEGVIDADSKGKYTPPSNILLDDAGYPVSGNHYNMADLRKKYRAQLQMINSCIDVGGMLLFHGCNVAMGQIGERFLIEISKEFFPGKSVVAFSTVQYFSRSQMRPGEMCANPGSLDSDYTTSSFDNEAEEARRWTGIYASPQWASENSSNAKVAKDGVITKGKEKAPEETVYTVDAYLPGTWSVTIGGWSGFFLFATNKGCSWSDGGIRHTGKWKVVGSGAQWRFDDDLKGWERDFFLAAPFKSNMQGDIKIKDVPHGGFVMSKQF